MKKIQTSTAAVAMSLLLATASFVPGYAQNETEQVEKEHTHKCVSIKYCNSNEELAAGEWKTADSVTVITKTRNQQMWWGGNDFRFDSHDKQVKKLLKKDAFAIMYGDTLLLNTRPYKDRGCAFGNGYARAFKMSDGHLLLTYLNVKEMTSRATIGGMFGLIGALATAAASKKVASQNVCYVITPGNKKALIVDEKLMAVLLNDYQPLLDEYRSVEKKKRLHAETVMPLLKKAGLL